MRLWSIHPKYLDSKGLVAVWREGLLAKKVLEGATKGYTHHPQLLRFKNTKDPLKSINQYLLPIYYEATLRLYNFDRSKIEITSSEIIRISVHSKQVQYEFELLQYKLSKRSSEKYEEIVSIKEYELHPMFFEIPGPIEQWEKLP